MPFNSQLPAEGTNPWYAPLVTAWAGLLAFVNGLETSLSSKASSDDLATGLAGKASTAALTSGLAGKADLVGGVVPTSQIPAIAISEFLGPVSSQAAMLALSGQKGDWATRTDGGGSSWIITGDNPTQIGSWTRIVTPTDAVTLVNGQVGAVVLGAADVGAATAAQGAKADSAVQPAALTAKADDSAVVKLTGAQSVGGVKTFTSAPVVPDGSFAVAKVTGLQGELDSKVESGNDSIVGFEYYPDEASLPDPGVAGVIYFIDQA